MLAYFSGLATGLLVVLSFLLKVPCEVSIVLYVYHQNAGLPNVLECIYFLTSAYFKNTFKPTLFTSASGPPCHCWHIDTFLALLPPQTVGQCISLKPLEVSASSCTCGRYKRDRDELINTLLYRDTCG